MVRNQSLFPQIDSLLFFGSFDPPHFGHATIMHHTLAQLKPTRLEMIVLNANVAGKNLAPVLDRIAMLELFVKLLNVPAVHVNCLEIDEHLTGHTIETLTAFHQHFPDQKLGIMIGGDHAATFHLWHDWSKILELATVFFMTRPGFSQDMVVQNAQIFWLPSLPDQRAYPTSYQLKKLINAGKIEEANQATFPELVTYILDHHLYRGEDYLR